MSLSSQAIAPVTFILIDDDPVCIWIQEKAIERMSPDSKIFSFTDPLKGFNYVAGNKDIVPGQRVILLLDLNMPLMDGWDFLEKFARTDEAIKQAMQVYVLSSTLDQREMDRAHSNPLVTAFLQKPLTADMVRQLVEGQIQTNQQNNAAIPAKAAGKIIERDTMTE